MTMPSDDLMDRALRWVRGEMTPAELARFAEEMRRDADLRETVRTMESLEEAAQSSTEHPRPDELALYDASSGSILGHPARTTEIRNHLSTCRRCRDDLSAIAEFTRQRAATPTILHYRTPRRVAQLLLAAAAMLGVTVVSLLAIQHRNLSTPAASPRLAGDRHHAVGSEVRSFTSMLLDRSKQPSATPSVAELHLPLAVEVQQMLLAYEKSPTHRPAILAELSQRWSGPAGVTLKLHSLAMSGSLSQAVAFDVVRGGQQVAGDSLLILISGPDSASVTVRFARR